jgi:hypothetical protein
MGAERGLRETTVFKTVAFVRSAILPWKTIPVLTCVDDEATGPEPSRRV